MRKRVKSGIEKNYCDKCGKLIYDLIPKNNSVKLLGVNVPEYTLMKHNDYIIEYGCKKRGISPACIVWNVIKIYMKGIKNGKTKLNTTCTDDRNRKTKIR